MKKLPMFGQLYLIAICIMGLLCLQLSRSWLRIEVDKAPWEVLLFIALAVFAGGKKITITNRFVSKEAGSMTLGFAITLVALVNSGPATAMFAAVVGCLSSSIYPKRQPAHQLAFNVALASMEAFAGGHVYEWLRPPYIEGHATEFFSVVAAAAVTYYMVNTAGVAVIIAISARTSPFKIWRESFIWAAPGYLATASITALATMLFHSKVAGMLVFVLPVLYLVFQFYTNYQTRALDQDKHEQEIKESQEHLAELYLATIKSLALAIDAKDQYTHQHILRVQRYSVAIAKEMGLEGAELEAVNTGALLHDIGKLGVPEYVLMKPGRLSPDEFEKIKKHPEIGEAILDPVEFPWPVLPVVRSHHEKWDGTGYPDGLKGLDIPLTARIMAVADVYDALTSSRSYRTAWSHEKATAVIQKDAGTHFDPVVVEAFSKIIDGVVEEMAKIGEGPLAPKLAPPAEPVNRSAKAAEDISRASTELYALYEVNRTLNSSLGSQDTVDYLCRKLEQLYPGAAFALLLREGNGPELFAKAAKGLNEEFFRGSKPVNENSRTYQCLRDVETYFGEYDQEDILVNAVEGSEWVPLQSCVIVPLTFEGHFMGTLNCYHPELFGFSPHDRSVFEMIAGQASESLYNSLLFDRIRGESQRDPLTQLYNLRHLTSCVEAKCKSVDGREPAEPFSLLCVDIDHFRAINEVFGHERGDYLLQGLANLLKNIMGDDTTVARYGSDEFLILLSASNVHSTTALITSIEESVAEFETDLLHTSLGEVRMSVTVGWAMYPNDGTDFASIVAVADAALKKSKGEKKLSSLVQDKNSRRRKHAA